jgi:FkbM family methyltransferase
VRVMTENWLKPAGRTLFRWYLSKFPLRDGKAYFYQLWHSRLAPAARYATARLDQGFTMKLDLWDPEQLKIYFYGHYHERYEAALVRRLLTPGAVFWDIGANVGYFSLVAAHALNNRGQVVAFEPGKSAYARLNENIALNPFTNIKTYEVAVAAATGDAVLFLAGDTADSSANLYSPGQGQTRRQVCKTVSLDHFLKEQALPAPHLIKMDVEGAEYAALEGARDLIAQHLPLLLMEMEEKNLQAAGADKAAIQRFLSGYGYRPAFLYKGRWHVVAEVQEARGRNIFWFHPRLTAHRQKAASLPVLGTY